MRSAGSERREGWRQRRAGDTMYSPDEYKRSKMPLVIRLPAEIEAGLRRLSDEENRSQADIVRGLIAERLGKRKAPASAYAVARRLGVIGCDDDSRTDVAERHSEYVRAALRAKAGSPGRSVRRRTRRG